MTRLPVLAIAAFSLFASPTLLLTTMTPVAAQDNDWSTDGYNVSDSSLRDLLRDWIQERGDRHDMLMDLIQERRDQRDMLLDLLHERQDRRSELVDFLRDHPGLRERLRERLASRSDDEGGGVRERLRERLASRWDDADEGGGLRGRLRERLDARMEGGDCYFLTRSLRTQDGSLLVLVRRRVCRD